MQNQSKHKPFLSQQQHETKGRRLLLNEEEGKLAVRPILPRIIPDAGCRAQSHNIPKIHKRSNPFPAGSFPHLLQNLCTDPIGRHPSRQGHNQMTCLTRTSDLDPNSTVMSIIQAIWRFRQRCHRTLEVCLPQFRSGLWSSKNVVFFFFWVGGGGGEGGEWQKFVVSAPCRFHCPKGFCLLTVTRLLGP